MFSLQKPSADSIRRFLADQAKLELSYHAVGATARQPPADHVVDHTRVKVGEGESTFLAAHRALVAWEHFRLGWLEPGTPGAVLQPGELVAVIARVNGLWWMSGCRIVYVVNERGPITRFGFAYGTLPDHIESGEERFLIEWRHADDSVWYDILAFSRPRHALARLGYPLVRRLQKRFARESAGAMLRAVHPGNAPRVGHEAGGV